MVEKLTDSFRAMISQPKYRLKEKEIIKSLLEYHDKNGGLTPKQIKLLMDIYGRYSK